MLLLTLSYRLLTFVKLQITNFTLPVYPGAFLIRNANHCKLLAELLSPRMNKWYSFSWTRRT